MGMKRIFGLLGLWLALCWPVLAVRSDVAVYPAPEGVELNGDFSVRVRAEGGEWLSVPSYLVKVDEVRGTKHCVENASMAIFDFTGRVEVIRFE